MRSFDSSEKREEQSLIICRTDYYYFLDLPSPSIPGSFTRFFTIPMQTDRAVNVWSILQVALLGVIAFLCACAFNGRWSAQDWNLPIEYGIDGPASDVKWTLASVKAASEGHYPLIISKHIPSFGAPFVADWDDYPSIEEFHVVIPGFLARFIGVFAAANLLVIMGHVLSVLGFYIACRLLKYRWEWSAAGALIFGFAPYLFARSMHHVSLAYVGHIPLIIVVFRWALSRDGLEKPRFGWALAIAAFSGVNNVYYTNMLMQFLGLACLYQAFHRQWRSALRVIAVGCVPVAAFIVMNLDTFWASHVHGPNPIAVSRTFYFLEYSGFKLSDLFIVPPTYWLPKLADWGTRYFSEVIVPGEVPQGNYLGLAGVAAFIWLAAASVRNVAQQSFKRPPWEAFLVGWVMLYATIGGLNGFIGSLGLILFRSTTRYSIFILALALMYAVRRLSASTGKWGAEPRVAVALLMTLIAVAEQMPSSFNERQDGIAQAVASDRTFAEQMEAGLKPNSMVFQIPIMNFPESPAPGVASSDHFRPFLYTKTLRYSFGDVKGHLRDAWQEPLALLSPEAQMEKLESYGFGALYVNGAGLQDHGAAYLKAASKRGAQVITSPAGDLNCIFLNPSATPVVPPQAPFFGKGWDEPSYEGNGFIKRFCRDTGDLVLTNPGSRPVTRYLQFLLGGVGVEDRTVTVSPGGSASEWQVKPNQGTRVENLEVQLQPGANVFSFTSDKGPVLTQKGPISFMLLNFQSTDSPVSSAAN